MTLRPPQIRGCLIAGAIAALVGCASDPTIPFEQLQDPATTPKEKWSDAMVVADAMGFGGLRDIPREIAEAHGATNSASSGAQAPAGSAVTAGIGYVSPPTGISGGAALGVGVGLMLLGGGGGPTSTSQVVAWVPSDQATTPEEAAAYAQQVYEGVRAELFPKRSNIKSQTGKYATGSGRSYATLADIGEEQPVPFDLEARPSPDFISAPESYGPIFIRQTQFTVDAMKNGHTWIEAMQMTSERLPEWFYIYQPGQKLRRNSRPTVIYSQGQALYFIGK